MIKTKECTFCKKAIDEKEKFTEVATHFNPDKIHRDYFHWICWLNYYKGCVARKSADVITQSTGFAGRFVKQFMGNVGLVK